MPRTEENSSLKGGKKEKEGKKVATCLRPKKRSSTLSRKRNLHDKGLPSDLS